ncbi:AsmA family protein [Noviherbaspirillum sp. ST9]|uniref:AsmA family protein n=1 Tax=Noviherbaspirillum sp. ST9 TaxID=3401606 RepID=UPI003B58848E
MRKTYKTILLVIAGVLVLLAGAAAYLAATFDPNDYKPQLIRLVQEKKQRTLAIPGEIKLSFFPKIGAELGKLSISEHKGNAEFASVESARVSLALIPLLSKQLVVDQVRIEGLHANIRRFKDGSTNYDDLLAQEEPAAEPKGEPGQQFRFDIDGIVLKKAQLQVDDQQQGRKLSIADLDLETGKIAARVPGALQLSAHIKGNEPAIDAQVSLKTGFTFDPDKQHANLKGLDAALQGALAGMSNLDLKLAGDADLQPAAKRFTLDAIKFAAKGKRGGEAIEARFDIPRLSVTDTTVSGGKVQGEVRAAEGARNMSASFTLPSFEGSPKSFRVPALSVDGVVRDGPLDAKLKLSGALNGDIDKLLFTSPQMTLALDGKQGTTAINGTLVTPLTVDLGKRYAELHKINAGFTLPNPAGGAMALKAVGNAALDYGKQSGSAMLNGSLDQSAFRAKIGISDLSPLMYTFDVGIDQLDLDRYRSKPVPAAAPAGKGTAAEAPLNFDALRKLHASGSVRIGTFKVANIKTSNARLDMRAAGGKLDIQPLSANLYGGSLAGALSVTAGNPARFAVRQSLTGIDIGPLMKDAIDKDTLEGKGNVQLDVTSTGMTFTQIKQGLNGSARMELRDGAIRGVNIAQTIRDAKARIVQIRGDEKAQGGVGSAMQKTDFSELTGSFRIVNGVAHNEDLLIKSPLVRVAGSGDIHLAENRLDYLARTTIVSTLQGQGGPELQSLKGLTVPVRLSGPFNAIGWRVDLAGMASELAKQKLDERKEEVRAKAEKSLDEQKEKVRGQLQEKLKGLLGR